jgi:hypothetical protein
MQIDGEELGRIFRVAEHRSGGFVNLRNLFSKKGKFAATLPRKNREMKAL